MKKLLKIASLFMLLISGLSFAQNDPKGCIPNPFDDLIKHPITKDMLGNPNAVFREKELVENLVNFKENLFKYASGSTVPKDLIDIVEHSTETAYYEIPQKLVQKSTSVDNLRTNIRADLKVEKNNEMIELYVLWDYQLQILQNSGLNYQNARFGWGHCISGILGGVAIGAGVGGGVGTLIPGIGTASGAVAGGLIGGTIGAIKNCR